jgi:predicted ATPase/class 3 adenylate cyclase/tetratricopeptide (TPR) repeat protein
MSDLPTGTVTFLYTDIEGSTMRWERNPAAMKAAVQMHDEIMRRAIRAHDGSVFRIMGDAFCASFSTAPQALAAALDAQRALHAEVWDSDIAPLLVRMALHTGVGEVRDGDYVGTPLNRVARLLSTGYGGQTLLSRAAYDLVHYNLPDGVALRDLGEHHLKDLTQAEYIFQLVVPDLPSDFPPLKSLDERPNNLPTQPTPLIGRQSELAALCALVLRPDTRVVTLTGPGGIGKTRLALQAAADLLDDFTDGAFLVSLAPLFDPDLLASTIAQAINMHDTVAKPPMESLKDYLRSKQMLLVLDNFEQIVSAAPLVADLLSVCPEVKALVASREVLRIRGEKECVVPPLALPDLQNLPAPDELLRYDSVSLFVQRAQDVKSDFVIGEENAAAVAELCRRLDGLPLAIELAAARIKVLTPQAILARLTSRLTLLTGGARDLPARQQTLRNTIVWSYDLLPPTEQLLFRRLSVFVGGFTLEAAEAVCGKRNGEFGMRNEIENGENPLSAFTIPHSIDVLEGLMALIDKSLLRQEELWGSGEGRFMMLETIQEFARQMLEENGEVEQMRQRHAEYFTALASLSGPSIMSPSRLSVMSTLESDHDNLRAVLEWCASSPERYDMGLRLAADLAMFWDYQTIHMSEGRMWLSRMLSLTEGAPPTALRGNALMGAGMLAMALGEYESALTWLTQSRDICEREGDYACAIASTGTLGLTYQLTGDPDAAIRLTTEALERAEKLESPHGAPSFGSARPMGRSDTSFGLLPVDWARAFLNFILGDAYLDAGEIETARNHHQKSLDLYERLGLAEDSSQPLTSLGKIAMMQGNYEEARTLLEESLSIRRETNITWYVAITQTTLSDLARHQGDYDRAEELSRGTLKIFRDLDNRGGIAWALYNLGCVALSRKDFTQASAHFKESLRLRKEEGNKENMAEDLLGLAGVALGRGDVRRAALLLGAVGGILDEGKHLDIPERKAFEKNTTAARSQLGEAAYTTALAEGRAMAVDEVVEYALGSSQ